MKKITLSTTWVVCLLAMISCFLWGSAFACIKLGYRFFNIAGSDFATQILFAGFRFTLAGIMVIIANSILNRHFIKPSRPARIFTLSIFQTSLQYLFFYIGLAHASGVKSSIINGSGIFMTILIACLIFKQEKLTGRKILGSILGFIGIILVNQTGEGIDLSFSFLGEGFILISTLSSAFSSAFIKKFSKDTDVVMLSGYQFFTGGIMLSILGWCLGGRLTTVKIQGIFILIYLAFISAAAYTIWSILLKHNSVSKVSIFKFMNPLFGVVISAIILKGESQSVNYMTIIALVLVCAGIIIVNRKKDYA